MKLAGIILIFVTSSALGQNSNGDDKCGKMLDSLTNRVIYGRVDAEPKIQGGLSALYAEITSLKIPRDPDLDQIRIFISFIVEPNGDISGLSVENKIKSTALNDELLKLLKKYKWEAATCKGVKVPCRLVLKVVS